MKRPEITKVSFALRNVTDLKNVWREAAARARELLGPGVAFEIEMTCAPSSIPPTTDTSWEVWVIATVKETAGP